MGRETRVHHGLDISEFAIHQLSQKRLDRTDLFIGDILNLPFINNYFNIITCFDVLEHLKQPSTGLKEINRCLKMGGLYFISMPNTYSYGRVLKGENWFGYQDITHVSLLSTEEWETKLKTNGFTIVDRFYDFLWDMPYFKYIPAMIQIMMYKPFRLFQTLAAIKLPKRWGENLYFVARKTRENT